MTEKYIYSFKKATEKNKVLLEQKAPSVRMTQRGLYYHRDLSSLPKACLDYLKPSIAAKLTGRGQSHIGGGSALNVSSLVKP